MPRVLVACEMSGRVRLQFALRGWDAWSADLLSDETTLWNKIPEYTDAGHHYQGNVLDIIEEDWDLVIAHPPCTDLSYAGLRYFKEKQADGRQQAAIEFFEKMYYYPQAEVFVVIENPRGVMSKEDVFRAPDQEVEPWWFGDPLKKKTCLWYRPAAFTAERYLGPFTKYKTLPHLVPTNEVEPTGRVTTGGGSWRTDKKNGITGMNQNWEDSQGRARRHILRSITPQGFAQAAATQWGGYIEEQLAPS